MITASRRARDINSYFNQLGEGIGAYTPPQVQSLSRKPLTVAFEEIAAGKVEVSKKINEKIYYLLSQVVLLVLKLNYF